MTELRTNGTIPPAKQARETGGPNPGLYPLKLLFKVDFTIGYEFYLHQTGDYIYVLYIYVYHLCI